MKKILFLIAIVIYPAAAGAQWWNNPFEGICSGEYRVVSTLGYGVGELQINDDDGADVGYASIGITPSVGVWRTELRYTRFDDDHVSVDQYSINFKVDLTLNCEVQCLYWMLGWNWGDFDVDSVRRHGDFVVVDDNDEKNYWNAGVGYRYNWTPSFGTSIEYNYNDVGTVAGFGLGHLRSLTANFSYRF